MTNSPEQSRGGPFVKGAFLCESVMEGKDGTNAYIRVLDTITAEAILLLQGQTPPGTPIPEPPRELPRVPVNTWLVIMFAAGGALGRYQLDLRLRAPNGLVKNIATTDIHFDGRQHSANNIHVQMNLMISQEGPYSVEVWLYPPGDDPVKRTEVPFVVQYQRQPSGRQA
ncbi:MAG: hypothetical protein AB7I38_02820 [Dehalococcoidia bacterium]